MSTRRSNRREGAAVPGDLALAAATASVSANPRLPLPSRRRTTSDRSRWSLLFVLAGLSALTLLAINTPAANSIGWLFTLATGPACATVVLLFDDDRALVRPAQVFLLVFGTLLAAATIVLWLTSRHPGVRFMLFVPWLAIALLLGRGVGIAAPRLLLWFATLLLLGAALLWGNLLVTVQLHPVTPWYGRVDVVTGWPWPVYIGAIRGRGAPTVTTLPAALWLDYAVMLGFAAILLLRRSTVWLVRWLPRLCALLAIAHVIGGFRLALATDG